jgi:hypothetical protein
MKKYLFLQFLITLSFASSSQQYLVIEELSKDFKDYSKSYLLSKQYPYSDTIKICDAEFITKHSYFVIPVWLKYSGLELAACCLEKKVGLYGMHQFSSLTKYGNIDSLLSVYNVDNLAVLRNNRKKSHLISKSEKRVVVYKISAIYCLCELSDSNKYSSCNVLYFRSQLKVLPISKSEGKFIVDLIDEIEQK